MPAKINNVSAVVYKFEIPIVEDTAEAKASTLCGQKRCTS